MSFPNIKTWGGLTAPSTRARDDTYQHVIYSEASARVIECKDRIQWLIQTRPPKSLRTDAWRGVSYHRSKNNLIRVWRHKASSANGAFALGRLPERIGGANG